jgi:hypothetical protein
VPASIDRELDRWFAHGPSRVVLAFVLTPALPAFYAAMFFAQPWAFLVGTLFSYPAALLLGIPMYRLLKHFGHLGWWQLAGCGAVCAAPLLVTYWYIGRPARFEPFDLTNGLYVEAWGIFAGLVFWLIGVAGNTRPSGT